MLEHVLLFTGPAGAGTTTAIRGISQVDVPATDAGDLEHPRDIGEILLSDDERVRLVGIPAARRSELAAHIAAEHAVGLVLLVSNAAPDPIGHALPYLGEAGSLVDRGGLVVAVTHLDAADDPAVEDYERALRTARPDVAIPVLPTDARQVGDVRLAILSLLANLERHAVAAAPAGS